eukprot:2465316-Prymnesium_polylepis.1
MDIRRARSSSVRSTSQGTTRKQAQGAVMKAIGKDRVPPAVIYPTHMVGRLEPWLKHRMPCTARHVYAAVFCAPPGLTKGVDALEHTMSCTSTHVCSPKIGLVYTGMTSGSPNELRTQISESSYDGKLRRWSQAHHAGSQLALLRIPTDLYVQPEPPP